MPSAKRPFQAEFISDTHMNMWKYDTKQAMALFPALAPTLILAGDIGDPDEPTLYRILDMTVRRYKNVIYVPGNHEFYLREPNSNKTPASVLAWFQTLEEKWPNFHFLYRQSEVIDGVRIIGATGWTTAPRNTDWANLISEEGRKDREFIEQTLSRSKEPCLVVTHYPPTKQVLQSNFTGKITEYDYAQSLEYMFRPPLHTWIFGHVHQHHTIDYPYSALTGAGIIRLLCNPFGYPEDGITSPVCQQITINASR